MSKRLYFLISKKEFINFLKNRLVYILGLITAVYSYKVIDEFFKQSKPDTTEALYEGYIRMINFPLIIFLLLASIFLFAYYKREREDSNRYLYFSKPLKSSLLLSARFTGVTFALELVYLLGIIFTTIASVFIYNLQLNLFSMINIYIALPFLTILIWSIFILLLSTFTVDYRIGLPIIFLFWFLVQLFDKVSPYLSYQRLQEGLVYFDSYFLSNRTGWLILGGLIFIVTIHRYNRLRRGEANGPAFIHYKSDKSKSRDTNIKLLKSRYANILYSIKIFVGKRIYLAVIMTLTISISFGFSISDPHLLSYLFRGIIGEVLLSLIAIIGASGINTVEIESNFEVLRRAFPVNEGRVFLQKLYSFLIYSVFVICTYLIVGIINGMAPVQLLIVVLPSYLLFAVITFVFTALSKKMFTGSSIAVLLWFISLILERKIPYWIHPFYFLMEFDHFGFNFLLYNKMIIFVLSFVSLITLYLFYIPVSHRAGSPEPHR